MCNIELHNMSHFAVQQKLHNTVNQLYFNKINLKKNDPCNQQNPKWVNKLVKHPGI